MHAPLAIKQPARWRVIVAGICALILHGGAGRFCLHAHAAHHARAGGPHALGGGGGWPPSTMPATWRAPCSQPSSNDLGRKYLDLPLRPGDCREPARRRWAGQTACLCGPCCGFAMAGFSSTAGAAAGRAGTNWLIQQGTSRNWAAFCGAGRALPSFWRGGGGAEFTWLVMGPPPVALGLRLLGIAFLGCMAMPPP